MRQYCHTSLISINNVKSATEAAYYVGKRVAFVIPNEKQKVVYGRITKVHGNSGVVRAKFMRNLPAEYFGSEVRVLLYPQAE